MFKAIVLACVIGSPTDCVEFHDARGPYYTERECRNRAMEMSRAVGEIANLMPIKWRCDVLRKGMLS